MSDVHQRASERVAAARAEFDRLRQTDTRGFGGFQMISDAAQRMERAMSEAHHCYGEPYKCISCGCSKGLPCVSHKGSAIYANELLAIIAAKP